MAYIHCNCWLNFDLQIACQICFTVIISNQDKWPYRPIVHVSDSEAILYNAADLVVKRRQLWCDVQHASTRTTHAQMHTYTHAPPAICIWSKDKLQNKNLAICWPVIMGHLWASYMQACQSFLQGTFLTLLTKLGPQGTAKQRQTYANCLKYMSLLTWEKRFRTPICSQWHLTSVQCFSWRSAKWVKQSKDRKWRKSKGYLKAALQQGDKGTSPRLQHVLRSAQHVNKLLIF